METEILIFESLIKSLELIKADVEYNLEGNDKYALMKNKEDLLNLKASFDNQYVKLVKYKGIDAEEKFKVSFEAKSKINSFLIKINRSLGNLNKNKFSGETNLELPKFQLPTFSGDISDWLSFKEIFIRSIDQNPTLGNFQKLQYLNSALKGNAARLIRAFNISDENYPIAWQTLVNRFDKKSELAFKQNQNLYDLKNVKQESTKDLLDLLDTCNESIQNLSILGLERNNLSDMILIHIIQSKLDRSIRKEWEMSFLEKEYPSYEKIIYFLERFAGSLGSFQNKENLKQFYKMNKSTHSHSATFASGSSIDSRVKSCVLCKEKDNWPYLKNLLLADPNFDKSSQIDLVIGAELAPCLFNGKDQCSETISITWKKLQKSPSILKQYCDFMDEYLLINHMELIPSDELDTPSGQCYYIPHHCVFKEQSTTTKLRVVFDASCKTSNGKSLNDFLHVGPKLQQDIFNILIRFRTRLIAFSGDIEKMYRQVRIDSRDCDFQRILWRKNPSEPLLDYRLLTVTYGLSCAPYLGMRTLHQLARDKVSTFPVASKIVQTDFYVDDLLSGADTIEEATCHIREVNNLLSSAEFSLRKWRSNVLEVLSGFSEQVEDRHNLRDFESDSCVKILGICWNPSMDVFQILVNDIPEQTNSKRHLLSHISRIFDPIGWLSPVIIRLKILLQILWKQKLNWDDPLPDTLCFQWKKIEKELSVLNKIQIPRYFSCRGALLSVELHGFCDSSEVAYAAVFYIGSQFKSGQVKVSLIASKTRVAPLKMISIPRLELCAALLLATFYDTIRNSLCLQIDRVILWTDSKIVLSWIKSESRHWKPFIGNRIAEVQRLTLHSSWHYVISKDNHADCTSRGITPSELVDHSLWWRGPTWLSDVNFEDLIQTQYDFPKEISGRLRDSNLQFDEKHPIILPRDHFITELIVRQCHLDHLYSGLQLTMSAQRLRYWIPAGRSLVKKIIHQCMVCFRVKRQVTKQIMGDLPMHRIVKSNPFTKTGIDFAGTFLMKPNIKRSKVKLESYVALFVCFCTKAIHIEIVSDLSSAAFLAALKRFTSRRGKLSDIISDNGTTFRIANNILREQFGILNASTIQKFISNERINWHFIPPSAPNFGGIWEAGIKSFKFHLLRCLKSQILTFKKLSTLTTQIEACLNSRPICPPSSDSDDFNPLTPGHLLIGRPLTALPESNDDDDDIPINYPDRWSLNHKIKMSTEAQINDEMEQCEAYSLQVEIVAQKVKEYESKLAAPCDDKMSQSSTSDVKRQIKLPKFELKKYTAKMLESDRLKRVQDVKVCFKCFRKNHLKKDCRFFVRCKRCQGPHFEIMCRGTSHSQENLNWRSDNRSHNSLAEQNEGKNVPVTTMANQVCTNNISLMTLIVKIRGPKHSKMVRVLLDSGTQKSYIRRSLAKELDLLKVGEVKLNKFLFGGKTTGEKAHSIFYFQLDNVDERKDFKMETVDTGLRQWELDKKGITLTEVDNNKTEIDILIGGDYYGRLLTGKIEQLAGGLTAIQTVPGWTLIGNTSSERPETSAQMVITLLTTQHRVTSLWELETIGIRDPTEVISEKEENVLMQERFREKICRGHDGHHLVYLPWKEGIGTIPNNLEIAKRRLEAMTQKLTQKGQFVPYDEVFRSWFRENLIEEVDGEDIKLIGHYLPHRPIYKVQSETTPIRPVYDASCKASKRSLSLNECLETGPNLIEPLPEILIRFREKKIGAIADIRKAFQTIGIDEKERDYLRFLWWDEQDPSKIRTLRHTRVVFGLTCSPFILAAVLKYHLESIVDYRKPVADVLKRSFYVDNLVFSVDEPDELERIREVANDIRNEVKMTLREWEYGGSKILENKEDSRVLGLYWNKERDTLRCHIPQDTTKYGEVTKRTLLSNLQKFSDPLGFYAPIFLIPKLSMQRAWLLKLGWDQPLPSDIQQEFKKWSVELDHVKKHEFPRYAKDGVVHVSLLVAKTRVAPLKSITIPRLELLACLLSARLTTSIVRALARPIKTIFWSDSSTALSWISTKHEWSIFVSNRVNEIRSSTNIDDWRFVPGTLNPADLSSRGCYAPQFILSKWWEEPQWLRESEDKWPKQKPIPNEEQVLEEKKGTVSPEGFRKPVLLPCDHPITEQLIRETHSNNCHAGVHFLLSKLREKFWILKARKTIKRVVRGCIICRRHAEKADTIPCAPLPKDRLFMGRPFEVTGVVPMGPLYLKNGQKIWITLFTCAVYRAVHLELVEGEVVLIGQDDQKIIFWPLGRILELYPGKDGRERVARVRTATGEFVRPLKRLFSLELGSDISREVRLPKTEGIKAQ
ncbi:hypothetical protein LAZ67_1006857 [Cordylochernes scorpioides]|uniref:Integrase catalytic domain-containing protein n=1 Tax=Cordylochernes scorpioides TaxID=51811 RepID=A0ABY6K0B8_9ARAC|nr:hypothetical protein LAZ67_1006857 [Cordylochernes scorpioides]